MLDAVRTFLHQHLTGSEPMVVAVSGGPDSVALLRALVLLQATGQVGHLIIAHVNHQLRDRDSAEDEAFVLALAQQLQAERASTSFRGVRRQTAADAQAVGANLESLARQQRYDWFAEVAREDGARWVATGHTADDQAETVLHRLLRGSGWRGLAGIPPRRPLAPGVDVIRPLLGLRRTEVLKFLAGLGQHYRQDSSNLERRFLRNRIRHELLPLLARDYNPAIVEVLRRLADQARELQQQEETAAAELLLRAELPRAGPVLVFRGDLLRTEPVRRVAEVFRLVWRREGWPMGEMGRRQWRRVAAVACGEVTAVDLPGRVRARRRGTVVQLRRLA